MLGLGNSMMTGGAPSEWLPSEESSLIGWWRSATGITHDATAVSQWDDQSAEDNHAEQSVSDEKPTWESPNTHIDFDDSDHLDLSSQITITGVMTLGLKFNVAGDSTIIGDDSSNNEMIKVVSNGNFRVKNNNANKTWTTSTNFKDAIRYVVVTRDGSNNVNVWLDGVDQGSKTQGGNYLIDTIGKRKGSTTDQLNGDLYEIVIFTATSADLTTNLNKHLKNI